METIQFKQSLRKQLPNFISQLRRGNAQGKKQAREELVTLTENADKFNQKFPNSFQNWIETYHEVCSFVTHELRKVNLHNKLKEPYGETGYTAIYEITEKLTDEFEQLHKGRKWDGEFYDEVETFVKSKWS